MSEWKSIPLSSMLGLNVAGEWGSAPKHDGSDVVVVRGADFTSSGKLDLSRPAIRSVSTPKKTKLKLQEGDILLEKSGGSPDQPVGRVCIFEETQGEYLPSNFLQALRVNELSDSQFLFYLMKYEYESGRVMAFQQQTTGIINFKLKDYLKELFYVPEQLAEQRKIAKILSIIDNLIEKTQALINKYHSIKQGMMHDLFTCGVDENGHLRPSYEEAPHQYKESELGWIPKEWDLKSFDELGEYVNGNSFDVESWCENGLPIIRIQNINGSDEFNYYDGPVDPAWEVLPGDLLFAWSGTLNTSFGPSIWSGNRGVLNQHIFKVKAKSSLVSKRFLFLLLNYKMEEIVKNAHGFKSSFVHITRGELTSVMCEVSGLDEQQRITSRLDSLDKKINLEGKALGSYQMLKSGLMQDLLTGMVRVKLKPEED